MALIKGVNYFPGKTAVDVEIRYFLAYPHGGERKITEREAAQFIRAQREYPEHADMFTVVRETRERVANACMYCGSRPRTWEWDCDGLFENSTCDSDQCRAGRFRD